MNLLPTPGLAIIVEDKKESVSKFGIIMTHKNDNVGLIGVIHAINASSFCPDCQKTCPRSDLKVGDRVIFSKFTSEHIELKEEEKRLGGRILSVPIDSIVAVIHD